MQVLVLCPTSTKMIQGRRPQDANVILAVPCRVCLIGTLFSLLCMPFNVISVEAASSPQGYTATSLLAEKEAELNTFVRAVEANARNCDALKTCSTNATCSRLACYKYGTQGDPNYKCLGVASNSGCGTDCRDRNFDYTRSFLLRVDTFDPNIAQTVCTQRTLDDQFRSSSIGDSTHLFRAFYGSVDGTARLYPGLDESCDSESYDPRLRPWYEESIYVSKGVTILIDCGRSMRDKLIGAKEETYVSKEINAALAVLKTLREDSDYVNIMCFDRDGIKPPAAKSQRYNSQLLYQSFSDNLTQIANGGITENPSGINTSDAIKAAISELTNTASPVPPDYLKVLLVLTGGQQYQNLSDLNIPANSSVNVFVYNFLTTDQTAECNPAIRASSEEVSVKRFDNPLLFLQSYYSFLAKVHQSLMGTQIDYGQQYGDFSGVDNSTLTLSKSAFGPTGEHLGVVGIDFFQQKVEQQYPNIRFQDIVIAARDHRPKVTFDPNALTTSVCFNHTDACPGVQTDVQGFLCGEKTGNEKIGCCGKCTSKNTHRLAKILGSVFGSVFVLGLVFTLCWKWDKGRNRHF